MNRSAIKPTRRRFFSMRGSGIEFAIGMVAVALLESERANAAVRDERGVHPLGSEQAVDSVSQDLHAALGHLADIDPAAVKTLSLAELKALLTSEALASLGLGKAFAQQLDTDPELALRKLETAFRKKIAAVAHNHEVRASATHDAKVEHVADSGGEHLRDGDLVHDAAAVLGGIPLIWPLLGAAVIGGVAVAASGGGGKGGDEGNHAPVANADTATTAEDTPVTFDVRTNDTDRDNDALSVTQINGTNISTTAPVAITGGSISLGTDGRLTFTPSRDYNGSPTFTYTLSDGHGATSTATVTLTVTPVNDAPVNGLTALTLQASSGAAVVVPGLSVSDIDSAALTTTVSVGHGLLTLGAVTGGATVAGVGTGTLTLTGTQAQINASLNALIFTGTAGFSGTDTLTIKTSDGQLTDTDTLTINVARVLSGSVVDGYISGATVFFDANGNGVYDAGEVRASTDASGHFALAVNGPILGNMVAFGGVNIDTGLANQAVLVAPAGSSVVNPLTTMVSALIASGVSMADASAQISAVLGLPAGIDLTNFDFLSPASVAAAGVDPSVALSAQKAAVEIVTVINQAIASGVSASAAANAIASAVKAAAASGGSVDLGSSSLVTSILINSGLSADAAAAVADKVASINQSIAAATSAADVSSVQKALNQPGVNLAPAANDDSAKSTDGKAVTFNVLANDKDPEGGALTLTKINGITIGTDPIQVTGGTITVGANGELTFTPNAGFSGSPSFTYTVEDPEHNAKTATVRLSVSAPSAPTNQAPVATADTANTTAGAPAIINVLANDRDADGNSLVVTQINGQAVSTTQAVGVAGGSVILNAAGEVVFTPNLGYTGTSNFDYTVSDGAGGTSTASVSVATGNTSNPVLSIAASDVPAVVGLADTLHNIGYTTIDLTGDGAVTLTEVQASALVGAGLHFAADDNVTVEASGTHLSSTLKGLTDLHVSAVRLTGAALGGEHVVAGEGLGAVALGGLPHFVGVLPDGTLVDPNVTLDIQDGNLTGIADFTTIAHNLHLAGIDHLDSATDTAVLTDAQATALLNEGIDFAASDTVSVNAGGTHLSTSLKGLQDLHVSRVTLESGAAQIDAGAGLGSFAAGSLPHFVNGVGADADVTLDIRDGNLTGIADFTTIAHNLHLAGIDHLDSATDTAVLTDAQATALLNEGIDFAASDTVTVNAGTHLSTSLKGLQDLHVARVSIEGGPAHIDAGVGLGDFASGSLPHFVDSHGAEADVTLDIQHGDLTNLSNFAAVVDHLHTAGFDHLDSADNTVVLSDSEASSLVQAGIDFAADDAVTVVAGSTHMSTSLKGLQDLHVTAVRMSGIGGAIVLDAGADLPSLAAHGLPHFDPTLDVTVDIASGTLPSGFDFGHIGAMLEQSGVDHIGVGGDGHLSMSIAQAESFAMSGLDFAHSADVSLSANAAEVSALADNPFALAGLNIDHIDASGPVSLTDQQATNLVEAGLSFAAADNITVTAAGTHLSTSLKALQDLHVDTIAVQTGITSLHIDAGDLHGVLAADLPSIDSSLDVTLRVDGGEVSDVVRLADALQNAGIDHIALNAPLSTFDAATQAALTGHFNVVQETFTGAEVLGLTNGAGGAEADVAAHASDIYRELLTEFETSAANTGHGGVLQLVDGAASSLAEAGMLRAYTADKLIVDGTTSGDHLLTTLKDIADIGVDVIKVADQHSEPVYIDLGVKGGSTAVSDIQSLFQTLTDERAQAGTSNTHLVDGTAKVALVVDAQTADALNHVDGAMAKLANLGITEVDVLNTTGTGASPLAATSDVAVKLIGQEDPLYQHLHHTGG